MKDYKFALTDLRAGVTSQGKRYARVRAIANGPDSYNSIFTDNARKSIIDQIKNNGVGSKILHRDDVYSNVSNYLEMRMSNAPPEEKLMINTLKGQLPMTRYPIGKVVDAQFLDDNTIECIIEENDAISKLGVDEKQYLDASWDLVKDGVVKGVSVAFNTVKSFVQDGKTFIDNLVLSGLDFVDKAAHYDTQVIETFVRAAQESEGKKMSEEENKPVVEKPQEDNKPTVDQPKIEPQDSNTFKDVDSIVQSAIDETLSKKEAEKQAKAEADSNAERLKVLEAERDEAIALAQKAIEQRNEKEKEVVSKSNPHFQTAQTASEETSKQFEGMSLGEIMGKYLEQKQ